MDTLLATPPEQALLPDFDGGSIVNLMASIAAALGARRAPPRLPQSISPLPWGTGTVSYSSSWRAAHLAR
jgi:hypothetical protein